MNAARGVIVAIVGGVLFALSAAATEIDDVCTDRETLLFALSVIGERVVGTGTTGEGNLMELTLSPAGSWSVLETDPNTRCTYLRLSGDGFGLSNRAGRRA